MGIPSDRKIVMQLHCDMAFRWFVGLSMGAQVWDASTFSQNRRRRFDPSGFMEQLFDETVKRAMEAGLVSLHASGDGTLVRANASYKSFTPIEVGQSPEEYKAALRSEDPPESAESGKGESGPPQSGEGDRYVDFRGERRSHATHRSKTDPDCRLVSKGTSGTAAYPGYTVNAVMENRNRILVGVDVEVFRGPASETSGCVAILDRVRDTQGYRPTPLGADKGYFAQEFLRALFNRGIEPHIATRIRGKEAVHQRVRTLERGTGYTLSQRCRKKIEELFGEGKEFHGLRRFRRRFLYRVREELYLIATVLNYKRLATVRASG